MSECVFLADEHGVIQCMEHGRPAEECGRELARLKEEVAAKTALLREAVDSEDWVRTGTGRHVIITDPPGEEWFDRARRAVEGTSKEGRG